MTTPVSIHGHAKTVRALLENVKYTIDYYQREYKWETKNIEELLDDLESKFLSSYDEAHVRQEVERYGHYFLGSIVICRKNGKSFIIDGQQRLTTMTLLLIYLNNLQENLDQKVNVEKLIFSEKYAKKSFNLDVDERKKCMETLFANQPFDPLNQSPSVQNLFERYEDIQSLFPDTLKGNALPYFLDWLIDNIEMVEITAYNDDDAYTIFETMNDRGISLSPTDMLKGYVLSNIAGIEEKATLNQLWRSQISELIRIHKDDESDFFKAWLRAKFAESARERKKGAVNQDFEKIGTTFHKWVRDEKKKIGLKNSSDFKGFVETDFKFFSDQYIRIRNASMKLTPSLEYVYYNASNNFTLQYPLLLAPLKSRDNSETVDKKVRLVAGYIDTFIALRVWNQRTLGYSSIVYTMFNLMRDIRDRTIEELVEIFKKKVDEMDETFKTNPDLALNQQNRKYLHRLLARITCHIEKQSGVQSDYKKYITRDVKKPFEIEHIWADKFEYHQDEFTSNQDFEEYRNRIGGLLLVPRGFNQSFGDKKYEEKLDAYFGQNLLAKSLHPKCYEMNPGFESYVRRSGLPFSSHTEFNKKDLIQRTNLYIRICEEIWNSKRFERELGS